MKGYGKMKKRLFALLLSMVLVFGFMPTTTFASGMDVRAAAAETETDDKSDSGKAETEEDPIEEADDEADSEEDIETILESEPATPLLGSSFSIAETGTEAQLDTETEESLCDHGNDAESCLVCDLEEQIAALPTLEEIQAMTGDEKETVYAQAYALTDVYYDDLTEDEQAQVSNIDDLWDVLDYFSSGLTLTTLSADTSWYDDTDTSFILYDAADLAGLASLVNAGNDFSGKTITLGNSIDLNSEAWTPIGTDSSYPFSGTFDGNGYTVSGLYINGSSNRQGLFGYIKDATVKDLTVSGSVSGDSDVGGVVGYAYYSTVSGCTNSGSVSGAYYVGGVVGYAYYSTVSGCTNSGSISGDSDVGGVVGCAPLNSTVSGCTNSGSISGDSNVGGVAGYCLTVNGCINSGSISGSINDNGCYVGGVVGYSLTVNGCTNSGKVSGFSNIGGVVGNAGATVSDCSNSNDVSGTDAVGGVVGYAYYSTISGCTNSGDVTGEGYFVGGVAGYAIGKTVSNCLNSGDVICGDGYAGGVVGNSYYNTVTNCYSVGNVSGTHGAGGVVGYVDSVTVSNTYYLDTAADSGVGSDSSYSGVTARKEEQFASGEVAYLLNGSVSGGTTWYQNLDNGKTVDSYPVLSSSSGKVYAAAQYKCDGVTVNAIKYSNSAISDETLGHSLRHTGAKEATCTSDGNSEYWYCSECGKYFSNSSATIEISQSDTVVSATGHSLAYTEAKDATCTEAGNTEYWYCTECGKYFSDSTATTEISLSDTAVSATGHSLTHVESKDATCTADGNTEYWYCSECGKYFSDSSATTEISLSDTVVSATGHSLTHVESKDATCTADGNTEYWYCSECGKCFSDSSAATEISLSDMVVSATGHSWGETVYTWSDDGKSCTATRTCETDGTHVEEATATVTGVETKAATCTENGETTYTAVFSESWADEQTKMVEDIPATGHTSGEAVKENEVAATCTGDGSYDSVVHCTVCGTEISRETISVSATGHSWDAGVITTEATCTEDGVKMYTCTACGDIRPEAIAATGHSLTHVEAKEATGTENGNIEYWYCEECGKYFSDSTAATEISQSDTVISATGSTGSGTEISPQTGDNSNLWLWIAVMMIGGMGFSGAGVCIRKRKMN